MGTKNQATAIPVSQSGDRVTLIRKTLNSYWTNWELFALYEAELPVMTKHGSEKALVLGVIDLCYKDRISDLIGAAVTLEIFLPFPSQLKSYQEQFELFKPVRC